MAHATKRYIPQIEDLLNQGFTRYRICKRLEGKVSRPTVYRIADRILEKQRLAA